MNASRIPEGPPIRNVKSGKNVKNVKTPHISSIKNVKTIKKRQNYQAGPGRQVRAGSRGPGRFRTSSSLNFLRLAENSRVCVQFFAHSIPLILLNLR